MKILSIFYILIIILYVFAIAIIGIGFFTITNEGVVPILFGLIMLACDAYIIIKIIKELTRKSYVKIMLYLMCDIVLADKNKMVCELDAIKDFIRRNQPRKYESNVKLVKDILKRGDVSYEKKVKYCKSLKRHYSVSERETLLDYLFVVAYADGDCSLREKEYLRILINNMFADFSSKQREILFYTFCSKYEAKQSKKSSNQNSHKKSDNESNNTNDSKSQPNKSVLSPELQKAYAALGIQEDATESQIKARWRNLMRVNHPDKVESKGVAAVESATLKCQELNKAYEKIKSSRGMK